MFLCNSSFYLSPIVGDNVLLTVCVFMCLFLGLLAEEFKKLWGGFRRSIDYATGTNRLNYAHCATGRVHMGPNIVRSFIPFDKHLSFGVVAHQWGGECVYGVSCPPHTPRITVCVRDASLLSGCGLTTDSSLSAWCAFEVYMKLNTFALYIILTNVHIWAAYFLLELHTVYTECSVHLWNERLLYCFLHMAQQS